jgi:hypothetical protein
MALDELSRQKLALDPKSMRWRRGRQIDWYDFSVEVHPLFVLFGSYDFFSTFLHDR